MHATHWCAVTQGLLLVLLASLLAACAGPFGTQTVVEKVIITPTPVVVIEQVVASPDEPGGGETDSYRTPHPVLSDLQVRQAIAHCTDRRELIEAVYPYINPEEQTNLLMDTFLPAGHWAHTNAGITRYEFNPERGRQLLDLAGWISHGEGEVRTNEAGDVLALKFLTTDSQFRQIWAAVLEQQLLENCGIQIIRTHAPGAYVFGETTGLSRRDFDLAGFAWVGETDPKGTTLYTCDQIPLPSNNWEGQNYMGWCNEEASRAILAANNTLDREKRIEQFAIVQREFTKDIVSLPLFNRLEVAAARTNLSNFKPDPTEYYTANVYEWQLGHGEDTVVIGMSQEPQTLFALVDSFASVRVIQFLTSFVPATSFSYDYQPVALTRLPTVENGGATLEEVAVEAGDMVWSTKGEAVELAPGVEIIDAGGETITYEGGEVRMPQLSVTFEYTTGLKWEDGVPVKQADFELGLKIACDRDSGAVSYRLCESRQRVDFVNDRTHTVVYLPGSLWPEYAVYTIAAYPSHQILSDGRRLADVPAQEWSTLPEIAERPLSSGPYRIVAWEKGQRIVLAANPNFYRGTPRIPNVVISFISDANQAVAQLLNGTIDVLGNQELEGGAVVETVLQAASRGELQAQTIASPTWEHLDMNLYTR